MSAVFTVALHPLDMHTRKVPFVVGSVCPPWCIPENFGHTESCKSQKINYFAVLIYLITFCITLL